MNTSTIIEKSLDKAALQSPLAGDGRDACVRALKEGNDAQAIRATAILARAGESVDLPSSIRVSGWPNLPSRDEELRALLNLVAGQPDQYRSFVVALLFRKGPQETSRASVFRQYADGLEGASILEKTAKAIESLASRVERLTVSIPSARRRLLKYSSVALKKAGKRAKEAEIWGLFRALGRLYRVAPEPSSAEATELLDQVLTYAARGSEFRGRIQNLLSFFRTSDFPTNALKSSWAIQKAQKSKQALRDRFRSDLIAYACSTETEDRQILRSLLEVVLWADASIDSWLTESRARLKNLVESRPGELSSPAQVAAALRTVADAAPVHLNPDLLQDLPESALSQLLRAFEACAARIRELSATIENLKSPETIRSLAGQLIREEVERGHAVMGEFQQYAREKRMAMAKRLSESFEYAEAQPEKKLSPALENAIRAAISFLEGES